MAFTLPGVAIDHWLKNGKELWRYRAQHCVGVAGHYGQTELTTANSLAAHWLHTLADRSPDPRYPAANYPASWLEMLDMLPLGNCILNRDALIAAGGFADTAVLQAGFWWDACIRLSRIGNFAAAHVGGPRVGSPGVAGPVVGGRTAWNGGGWRGGYRHHHHGFFPGAVAGAVIGGAIADSYAYGPDYYGPDYYDDGYYDGGAEVAVVPGGGGDSVAYCEQRFRSYDPASGTYLGYDGQRHPCP